MHVPSYVLRIPVGYYRVPPAYFRGARAECATTLGQALGPRWQQQRKGWNQWNPRQAPAPAPLPVYQRQYSGDRYPNEAERQQSLSNQHYRYRRARWQPRSSSSRRRGMTSGSKPRRAGSKPDQGPRAGTKPTIRIASSRRPRAVAPAQPPHYDVPRTPATQGATP